MDMAGLKDIILRRFPTKRVGPTLVTYTGGDPLGFTIASGYLRAAKQLAVTLDPEGMDAGEDVLAFPLLFLVRHSLELSLKGYLSALLNHRAKRSCGNISEIDTRPLRNHELAPIFDSIARAISRDTLHSDPKTFGSYKKFIHSLDATDLSSESLRYSKNNDGKVCLFFLDQKYVVVNRLIEKAEVLINNLRFWGENEVFDLCTADTFRKKNVVTYQNTVMYMETLTPCRAHFLANQGQAKKYTKTAAEIAVQIPQLFSDRGDFVTCAWNSLGNLSNVEMANLALTIEIVKGHDSGINYFIRSGVKFTENYVHNNLIHLASKNAEQRVRRYRDQILALKSHWIPPKTKK